MKAREEEYEDFSPQDLFAKYGPVSFNINDQGLAVIYMHDTEGENVFPIAL